MRRQLFPHTSNKQTQEHLHTQSLQLTSEYIRGQVAHMAEEGKALSPEQVAYLRSNLVHMRLRACSCPKHVDTFCRVCETAINVNFGTDYGIFRISRAT